MTASATLMPVEEYLALTGKPYCEYLDGILHEKAMPTYKHGKMQGRLLSLIHHANSSLEATPELTVKLRERRYLIPDVAVQRIAELQQPYPSKPIHLCIEILSPEDRFSETLAKCEEYHAWGVPTCWIVDADEKQAWEYRAGGRPHQIPPDGRIATDEISLSLTDLFAGF